MLQKIGSPLTIQQIQLAGKTTPTASYAAAIAVIVSLMFVGVLLAAGLLALERSENAYSRLVRGLVTPTSLLSEKIVVSAACAAAVTLLMSAFVSLFVHLDWARFPLWVAALGLGGLAFGALGVAIGGLAREVSVASLMAFVLTLPIAFVALVPGDAVSGTLRSILDAVAFVFPFRAALQAVSNAFSGTAPGIGWPLVHLAVLVFVFGALARLALRRFACLRNRTAEHGEADDRHDQRDHRKRRADHAGDREHQRHDEHAAGDAAGHDQLVGPPLTRPPRRVVAPLLDIGHDSRVLPQTNKVLIQVPERRYVLFYDYVEDILERRILHREAHLAALRAAMEDGRVLMAGPLGDPPSGAAIVFAAPDAAEAFASADPYVINGLVTDRRVELWTLV